MFSISFKYNCSEYYITSQQTQSLYGYAQDGVSIVRSDDRGLTWSVTDLTEYTNVRIELFS